MELVVAYGSLLLKSLRSHPLNLRDIRILVKTNYHRTRALNTLTGKRECEHSENITLGSGKQAYGMGRAAPPLSHKWQPELQNSSTKQGANCLEIVTCNTVVRKLRWKTVLTCYFRDCEGISRMIFAEDENKKCQSLFYKYHHLHNFYMTP